MTPTLETLAPNLTLVTIGDANFWFSYKTCVAVFTDDHGFAVSENAWGPTTGKHLNRIDGGSPDAKKARLPRDAFVARLEGVPVTV